MNQISFRLHPLPPFRLDFTAWALRRRANNIIDRWQDSTYRRVLSMDGHPFEVEMVQSGGPEKPVLHVTAIGEGVEAGAKNRIKNILEKMFGLRWDLRGFYTFAEGHAKIKPLVEKFRGVKPPRFPSVFETLTNAITCQQLSLSVGILMLNRLAMAYGAQFAGRDGPSYSFPLAEGLERGEPADLKKMGLSRQKGSYLVDLARAAREEDLEAVGQLNDDAALERLYRMRGIGRWTGEYTLLRGLGRIHIFPGDDVGARNRLITLLKLKEPLDYEGARRIRKHWHPYGGFIYFHLLLEGLSEQGLVSPKGEESIR